MKEFFKGCAEIFGCIVFESLAAILAVVLVIGFVAAIVVVPLHAARAYWHGCTEMSRFEYATGKGIICWLAEPME